MPLISVVIITKNNAETIEECIVSLLNQTYPKPNYELIFVDGHSKDGTDEIIKKYMVDYPFLKRCYENYGTMGYARNLGINESKGDIIAFTDGDAVVPKDWIEKIAESFASSNLVAVGGLDLLVSSSESDKLIDSWRRLGKATGIRAIPSIKTVNFAIRRDTVLSCGGFDPELSHWDEAEMLARIYFRTKNARIQYDPNIVVSHKRTGLPSFWKRIKKTFNKSAIGTPTLLRKHMMKVALANPTSPLGISFALILVCAISVPLAVFSIIMDCFPEVVFVGLLTYVFVLGCYMINLYRRANKISANIPLILTADFVVRCLGSLLGIVKWINTGIKGLK